MKLRRPPDPLIFKTAITAPGEMLLVLGPRPCPPDSWQIHHEKTDLQLHQVCGNDQKGFLNKFLCRVWTITMTLSLDNSTWRYNDVIMGAIASQITNLTIVYSIVYSDADQRKHQTSASLAFVRWIHRWIPRTNGQLRGICFPFDDVIMIIRSPGTDFRNNFSIEIQIRWNIYSVHTPVVVKWSDYGIFTWHGKSAVVARAKICSNMVLHNGVTLKPIFHRIWTTMETLLAKLVSGQHWCRYGLITPSQGRIHRNPTTTLHTHPPASSGQQ